MLIVVDTLRADHVLDPMGVVDTPRLDALAADGVSFERAYAHTSWTLPSHTALFSSRPPHETGVTLNGQLVPAGLPLLAEWLSEHGYRTHAVHSLVSLEPVSRGGGLDRGFASYGHSMTMGYAQADAVTRQVVPELERIAAEDEPFFLFLHYSDPHTPYYAFGTAGVPGDLLLNGEVIAHQANIAVPEVLSVSARLRPGTNRLEFRTTGTVVPRVVKVVGPSGDLLPIEFGRDDETRPFGLVDNRTEGELAVVVEYYGHEITQLDEARRRYVLEVEYLDPWLGEVVDALKRLGLYDEALLVFTSDHGESLGEHGKRTHGLSVFDEVLHVPLIVKAPASHPAGATLAKRRSELVRHIDLAPTVLSLLDLPALPGQVGVSLLAGDGDGGGERLLASEMHFPLEPSQYSLFDGRWKLIWSPDVERCVLFDLEADPDELHDVFPEHAEDFAAWRERLRAMAQRLSETDVGLPPAIPPDVALELEALGYTAHR